MLMTIQNGTIFIADSHYNQKRRQLKSLLLKIQNKEIEVTQIIFMGDIFDFLTSHLNYFTLINAEIILLINKLATQFKILYLEGNHDFNLQELFPTIHIIKREEQPYIVKVDNQTIAMAHGDIFTPFSYNLYCKIIRNSTFMKFLNFIDIKFFLSKFTEETLMKKKICHKQKNFLEFTQNRIKKYNSLSKIDLIIEGHFHQGYLSKNYINLPSLACDNRYMVYQNNQFSFNTL
ncbi:MAG: UDP-2,3-diacylglucosamine hydrolase [Arcobacter sp.]|nr:MAG: UDP-2,3-diacylglucosamine hydrolase [Arcobacter sp.]